MHIGSVDVSTTTSSRYIYCYAESIPCRSAQSGYLYRIEVSHGLGLSPIFVVPGSSQNIEQRQQNTF